MLCFQRVCRWR